MEVLLKARHLAPTYGKRTALSPEVRDMLVIDPVPDVFHAGHVHTLDVGSYRGTLVVNSGTFQGSDSVPGEHGSGPDMLNRAHSELVDVGGDQEELHESSASGTYSRPRSWESSAMTLVNVSV